MTATSSPERTALETLAYRWFTATSGEGGSSAAPPAATYSGSFDFDVTADGRPLNVRVVHRDGAAPSPLESRYSRRLRETHFRPRIVAGEPVATDNVQLTHYFRFYVDAKKKPGAEEAGDGG